MAGGPSTIPRAEQYNTRKTIKQTQAGLRYERQLSAQDDMSIMMYAGERETTQYQSIPMAPQRRPSHAGGVIALQRHYQVSTVAGRIAVNWASP